MKKNCPGQTSLAYGEVNRKTGVCNTCDKKPPGSEILKIKIAERVKLDLKKQKGPTPNLA
jgi:hypothetical protein